MNATSGPGASGSASTRSQGPTSRNRRTPTIAAVVVVVALSVSAAAFALFRIRDHDWRGSPGRFTLLAKLHNAEFGMFSPDSTVIAFGTEHHLRLGYPRDGSRERELKLPTDRSVVGKMAFSPNGTFFAASDNGDGNGNKIRLWDARSGAVVWTVEHPDVISIAFSPDGSTLVSLGGGVRAWNTRTGRMRFEINSETPLGSIGFSSGGKLLTTTANTAAVWDATSGKAVKTLDFSEASPARSDDRQTTRFSEDGAYVLNVREVRQRRGAAAERPGGPASSGGSSGAAGSAKPTEGPGSTDSSSPTGPTSGDTTVSLWRATTGERVYSVTSGSTETGDFSPDGRYFTSVNDPDHAGDGTLTLWETATGRQLYTVDEDSAVFSRDGRYLATYSGGTDTPEARRVVLRTLGDGQVVRSFPENARVKFSPDSTSIVTETIGDHPAWEDEATLWTVPDANAIRVFGDTAGTEFSRDGRLFATFSKDFTRIWRC